MRFKRTHLIHLVIALGGALACAAEPAAPTVPPTTNASDGKTIFQTVCAQCHGPSGEGKVELKSPSIAGMPSWYARTQLTNFREGRRGHDAADPQSFLMAAVAKTLTPEQINGVLEHLEIMPIVIPDAKNRELAGANVADGMMLFQERCMECHRYNASGEMAFGSPPLIGRQAWYLEDQLKKFKSGKRGMVKNDINGAKMVQMTTFFIEDEQMLKDVVAYIMTLNPEPPPPAEKQQVIEGSPFETKAATVQR